MLRKPIFAMFCILCLGPVWSASGDLVGWWTFDETAGNVAADSSGYGNNGTVVGNPQWVPGKIDGAFQFDGNTYINCGRAASLNIRDQITIAFWFKVQAFTNTWEAFLAKSDAAYRASRGDGTGNGTHMGITGSNYFNAPTIITDNQWHHYCGTYDGTTAIIYIDGREDARQTYGGQIGDSANYDLYIGENSGATGRRLHGLMDDVQIYNNALTPAEILKIMEGLASKSIAKDPVPEDKAVDVPQDVVLRWTPGEYAATHDVYIGTSFADVNDADRADPKGLLVSQDQAAASYDGETLFEFGKTYFWRVDEVNAAPDNTIFKGDVWSFTAEPFAYPITGVTATASSTSRADTGPQNTVNGSGLNAEDQHSMDVTKMWLSGNTKPHWIRYEFDKVYKLDEMWVWNANQMVEVFVGFGVKDVAIEYSTDGATWTTLEGVSQFAQATGDSSYTANTIVDFGGAMAKYVRLNIASNWGSVTPQVSLSEVRFYYVPVQGREPSPADGGTDVSLTGTLNWRPGREATSHKVYFGTDGDAVAAGTAASSEVTGHSYAPAGMTFGTKYFWKVDELGGNGPYEGPVWSFTAQEFAALDDFEGYTDDEGSRIYESWLDGMVDTANGGSTVGYMEAPFAEQTIVRAGKQSMPLAFDNTKAPFYSEATLTFDTPQNCTGSGASQLCVWTRGYPAVTTVAVTETGGRMSVTGAGADIWNNSDEFTYAYKTLDGDGSLIARVVSIGPGTNTWAKGGVMIRDSLDGGSTHAMMVMTANTDGAAGNGASFQYRAAANGASANVDSGTVLKPPYWVKIERQGDILTGSTSADGKAWSQMGQTVIVMTSPVQIGLCVTSHAAGENRTFEFDGISATGGVSGAWQGAVINRAKYNPVSEMYLIVQDSAGKSATATSATAANTADWTRWVVPMSSLNGVNFSKITKLTIGVGNKAAPTAGGAGMVFIDDIGYGRSAQ
ncbi:MAG TPA: discoidin domain-containing protein [Candidatus Anammoximicrobium sp.]|nr:discoidin domain-containing protein [Candidatus Anammoximicrobium sp.]